MLPGSQKSSGTFKEQVALRSYPMHHGAFDRRDIVWEGGAQDDRHQQHQQEPAQAQQHFHLPGVTNIFLWTQILPGGA